MCDKLFTRLGFIQACIHQVWIHQAWILPGLDSPVYNDHYKYFVNHNHKQCIKEFKTIYNSLKIKRISTRGVNHR